MWAIVLSSTKIKIYSEGRYEARRAGWCDYSVLSCWQTDETRIICAFTVALAKSLTMGPEAAMHVRNGEKL